MVKIKRSAGILCHPTCIYTEYGIGDLGPNLYDFIDNLENINHHYWQVLPLGPTGYLDSPYQGLSAFAGNPLLISPEKMMNCKLIDQLDIEYCLKSVDNGKLDIQNPKHWRFSAKIDFGRTICFKNNLFSKAFMKFQSESDTIFADLNNEFKKFCINEKYWLDDYTLFISLKVENNLQSWIFWSKEFANRESISIINWIKDHLDNINYHKFLKMTK